VAAINTTCVATELFAFQFSRRARSQSTLSAAGKSWRTHKIGHVWLLEHENAITMNAYFANFAHAGA
jgi:hypothetical protein